MPRDVLSRDPRDDEERDYPSPLSRTARRLADELPQPEGRGQSCEPRPESNSLFQFRRKPESLDAPRAYYLGERAYFLRESEMRTLGEIGAFRAVAAEDLGRLGYAGDTPRRDRETRR